MEPKKNIPVAEIVYNTPTQGIHLYKYVDGTQNYVKDSPEQWKDFNEQITASVADNIANQKGTFGNPVWFSDHIASKKK